MVRLKADTTYYLVTALTRQHGESFYVGSVRKQIERFDVFEAVADFCESPDVARQCWRVARHINDARHLQPENARHGFSRHAGSWRIQDQRIRRLNAAPLEIALN